MKFIIDSESKTITLLEKISLREIEQLKIWLGADWENWTIDAKERVIEKDKWYPIPNPITQPFQPIPPTPFAPYPQQPFPNNPPPVFPDTNPPFYTICMDTNGIKEIMVECKSVNELASYNAVMGEANNFKNVIEIAQ